MKKLWQKNKLLLNSLIESFETEDDLVLDQKLINYDLETSLAHAKMLQKIGVLTMSELKNLKKGLGEIRKANNNGKFDLVFGDEDMHTKIENHLVKKCGEVGKKIHTGRSRNDQVLTAIRLFSLNQLKKIDLSILALKKEFKKFQKRYGVIPMPGYTHMQKAMPSSLGLWAGSFIDSLIDDQALLNTAIKLTDQSPLGSGAGYGVSLQLDKNLTAKLLNFSKVQENALYCQNSRGKIEANTLACLVSILLTINKFASDVLLFTTKEFGFFKVSDRITTGSSIMPQKKNLDVAELLRSKVNLVLGNYVQIVSLSSNLVSGYNRDLQDTKKPLIESFEITLKCLEVSKFLVQNLSPNSTQLEKSMTKELFSTEEALELVSKGMSFRDAYLKVGKKLIKEGEK